MKKILNNLLLSLMVLSISGCQMYPKETIEIKEMRAIAELATIECHFHNVIKSDQETDKVWFEFWKKNNIRFWVEYEGIVYIGIETDKVNAEIDGQVVRITLPKARVMDSEIDDSTLDRESFVYDPKSEKPTLEQEQMVFETAKVNLEKTAAENKDLLIAAEENAKELLENYVETIGEALGIEYTIEWVEVE